MIKNFTSNLTAQICAVGGIKKLIMLYIFSFVIIVGVLKYIAFSNLDKSGVYLHPRIKNKIQDENNIYK